ncbi:MAG: hypothetical protein COC01_03095 [Bacteroidetes bacterium]|nr:MAG: hypothetical protein COC01_03095 [Bacteroidota bacterium]
MKPEDVNSVEFASPKILYNDGSFTIAWGIYARDKQKYLAMRWDGENGSHGFPKSSDGTGRALWFIVDGNFTNPMLLMLENMRTGVNHKHVEEIIREIRDTL